MQTYLKLLIIPFLALFLAAGTAMGYVIDDVYYGADNHGYEDVIGDDNVFGITSLEYEDTGSGGLKITLNTNYLGINIGELYTSLGDFFISTDGWDPDGSLEDNYLTDNSSNGENWEYALVWGQHDNTFTNGRASLYHTDDGQIKNSEDEFVQELINAGQNPNNYVYRDGQEVRFVPNSGVTYTTIDYTVVGSDSISFTLSLDILGWDRNELAFHWASATCANDVIEGKVAPVPEPATMLLLGTGLLGLASLGRRKLFKK